LQNSVSNLYSGTYLRETRVTKAIYLVQTKIQTTLCGGWQEIFHSNQLMVYVCIHFFGTFHVDVLTRQSKRECACESCGRVRCLCFGAVVLLRARPRGVFALVRERESANKCTGRWVCAAILTQFQHTSCAPAFALSAMAIVLRERWARQ
jgi:hypothetical protein